MCKSLLSRTNANARATGVVAELHVRRLERAIAMFDDERLTTVAALLAQQRFDEACAAMGAVTKERPDDEQVWLFYAMCLNESGRVDAAIDAALRAWLLSGQTNGEAVQMAVSLLPRVPQAAKVSRSVGNDPVADAVSLLRDEISSQLGL